MINKTAPSGYWPLSAGLVTLREVTKFEVKSPPLKITHPRRRRNWVLRLILPRAALVQGAMVLFSFSLRKNRGKVLEDLIERVALVGAVAGVISGCGI